MPIRKLKRLTLRQFKKQGLPVDFIAMGLKSPLQRIKGLTPMKIAIDEIDRLKSERRKRRGQHEKARNRAR